MFVFMSEKDLNVEIFDANMKKVCPINSCRAMEYFNWELEGQAPYSMRFSINSTVKDAPNLAANAGVVAASTGKYDGDFEPRVFTDATTYK